MRFAWFTLAWLTNPFRNFAFQEALCCDRGPVLPLKLGARQLS